MSIILLNDLIFQDTEEGHIINKDTCLFFLILNLISIFCCSLYLYIYYKIPHYQNNSNTLTLILTRVALISSCSYFSFYSDLYFHKPIMLTVIMKICTMINPLVIFTYYFWCACLTHNIYVTFYNYAKNLDKRVKFYKYQLIVYLFIFYVFTMFSIKFKEKKLQSKYFSFIENYRVNYVIFFYLLGLFIIAYIISRAYYIIIIKSKLYTLTTPDERTLIIKKLFQSLIFRHLLFIFYFLFIFIPVNLMMIIKYIFRVLTFESYYVNFIAMTLISFYGSFIFIVKLTDPIMRHFLLSVILCNKNYIKDYEPLLRKEKENTIISNDDLTESFNDEREIIMNVYRDFDKSFITFYNERIKLYNEPIVNKNKYISFNLGNRNGLHFIQDKKEMSKFSNMNNKTFSMKNIKKVKDEKINSKNILDKKSSRNIIDSFYYEDEVYEKENEEEDNEKKDNDKNIKIENENNNLNNEKNNNNSNNISYSNNSHHERKCTVDQIYIEDDKKFNNDDNGRKTINPTDKIINMRGSNFPIKRKDTMESIIEEIPTIKRFSSIHSSKKENENNNFNDKKKELKKKRIITYKNKKTLNKIYEKFISSKSTQVHCKKYENRFQEEISGYALLNYHLEINENIQRMLAISICINNDRIYDTEAKYQQFYYSALPWKNTNFYKEKTPFNKYNKDNFPSFLNIDNDSRFKGIEFKILSYSPFVFHHLRLIDKVTIDDILKSLDIHKNLKIINDSKVTGGRGNNSMFRSWDKKLIIKTIDKSEKNLLINRMLEEYHSRMRDTKSILSHIYGVFKIEMGGKGKSTVLLQRNMNDLFLDSNILTFDLKGSTVDRQSIKTEDIGLKKNLLFNKYKNVILKDIDLKITDIKFELNPYDGKNILLSICNDSIFLQKYDVTDYSLLIFINKYNKANLEKHFGNSRIMAGVNNNYIFNFSIIDYLGTFNLEKKGEKLMKDFVGVFRHSQDKNFSVQDPQNYGLRFRKFAKKIIIYEKEDNDYDNLSS